MTTVRASKQTSIRAIPGTNRNKTALSSGQYTAGSRIRYDNGYPEKIAGWRVFDFDSGATISGCSRSIFSAVISNIPYTLIGTHQKLYSLIGSTLTNITPLNTSTTAIANSLDSHYATLGSDPVATTSGSKNVVITDTEASLFVAGDTYTLSGATTTNGVPDTELNTDHIVRGIDTNEITIRVSTAATSTGSGGGSSIDRSSGLITVNATGHGQLDGDRTKIADAADFAGFTASSEINTEHIIRNKGTDTFDIMTSGTATSSATSGGGASTTYQVEIADGQCDEISGFGYGAGRYGTGLYGTSRQSSTGRIPPRIWFWDRFGDVLVGTPGNGTGLYSWDGSVATAPALVTNAPTDINYAFVSDNILVTFGADGIDNRIKASDQNGLTTWSSSSVNQVYSDDIEGAGKFISHAPVKGTNLIFTNTQVYTFRYIGLPFVWEVRPLDNSIGLIGPMARVVVDGVAYWMGQNNFNMWRSGNVEIIPSNTEDQSTIRDYVFDDINRSQASKFFAYYNEEKNDIEFHYCSEGSNEPDKIARVCLDDFTWSDESDLTRTAAEYPDVIGANPKKIDSNGVLYLHEYGSDDDTSAMAFSLTGPLKSTASDNNYGLRTEAVVGIIPDSTQTGSITVNLVTKQYPQAATNNFDEDYTVSATTGRIPVRVAGKYRQYTWSGNTLGQSWKMGDWIDETQPMGRS